MQKLKYITLPSLYICEILGYKYSAFLAVLDDYQKCNGIALPRVGRGIATTGKGRNYMLGYKNVTDLQNFIPISMEKRLQLAELYLYKTAKCYHSK